VTFVCVCVCVCLCVSGKCQGSLTTFDDFAESCVIPCLVLGEPLASDGDTFALAILNLVELLLDSLVRSGHGNHALVATVFDANLQNNYTQMIKMRQCMSNYKALCVYLKGKLVHLPAASATP
jgi:hypothetical protein